MRDHFPEEIAAHMIGDPRLIDGSFVDEALRGSQVDRLFEVPLKFDKKFLLYTLLEHKSTPDPRTPFQIARYMVNIWERYANEHRNRRKKLPAILPLVFYHGERKWNVPFSVFDMIEDNELLRPFTRSFTYLLRDLRDMSPEQLSSTPDIRAAFQVMNISGLDSIDGEFLIDILSRLVDDTDLETAVLNYIVRTKGEMPITLEAALQQAKPERWRNIMGTIAEGWIKVGEAKGKAEGEAKGKAEGEAKGKAEGEAKGKAETFLRQARLKFGKLPQQRVKAVQNASITQLDHWLEALITAENLESIFKAS